jgi:ketosteroid isomerase-like protein
MEPVTLLQAFCAAVEAGDGAALAQLFTPDGIYHDVFYGSFLGRARIAEMLTQRFHRDAGAFRWDMFDPVSNGKTLYARYLFSFTSKLPGAEGKRAMFEGVSIMTMRDGLIADYREVADVTPGLIDLGFPPERIARLGVRAGETLRTRPEAARHVGAG